MSITPYLYYEDVGAALEFLTRAFRFKNYGRPMKQQDGRINHAAMKIGKDLVMMGYPGAKYKNPKRLKQATQSLYINVSNVDKHFERAKKAGAKILAEPEDQFYGDRRYGAEDPEGHQWYFAQELKKRGKRSKK